MLRSPMLNAELCKRWYYTDPSRRRASTASRSWASGAARGDAVKLKLRNCGARAMPVAAEHDRSAPPCVYTLEGKCWSGRGWYEEARRAAAPTAAQSSSSVMSSGSSFMATSSSGASEHEAEPDPSNDILSASFSIISASRSSWEKAADHGPPALEPDAASRNRSVFPPSPLEMGMLVG